jgi:hypothetical protein
MDDWTSSEKRFFKSLNRPGKIQSYLNSLEYDPDCACRSPRFVIKEKKAHCFEGALFASAALRFLGHTPMLVDMKSENDDDHVISVFRSNGCWGAIAKSNFTTIRFREPVYKTVRELVLSYFDFYYNTLGQKTLREYSLPIELTRFDGRDWMTTDKDLEYIGDYLDSRRHVKLLTPAMVKSLEIVDEDLQKAGLLGAKKEGLYKPSTCRKVRKEK